MPNDNYNIWVVHAVTQYQSIHWLVAMGTHSSDCQKLLNLQKSFSQNKNMFYSRSVKSHFVEYQPTLRLR